MMKHASAMPTPGAVRIEPEISGKLFRILAIVGGVGLLASAGGFVADRAQFFHSYLVAFVFCLGLSLGALFFTLLQYVTGARWSIVVRRISENIMANFVVLAILFLPLLLGLHDLYHWTHTEAVLEDALLQTKSPYLNVPFLMIRLVIYFAIWAMISLFFNRQSVSVDDSGDARTIKRLRAWSGPCILVYALTQTFAAFDLLMSLDPHWYSTIFGVYFFAGTTVTAFSVIALVALILRASGKLAYQITSEHYHDLGKLMFGFTVFWAYIAFSQFVLIWYGNIPEETTFYLQRWEGSWKIISLMLLFGHFVLPFAVLLSRHTKRELRVLGIMAGWIILMEFVDIQWLVLPSLHHEGYTPHWLDFTCLVGVLGLFGAMVVRRFGQHPLISLKDPLLTESLEFENV